MLKQAAASLLLSKHLKTVDDLSARLHVKICSPGVGYAIKQNSLWTLDALRLR